MLGKGKRLRKKKRRKSEDGPSLWFAIGFTGHSNWYNEINNWLTQATGVLSEANFFVIHKNFINTWDYTTTFAAVCL